MSGPVRTVCLRCRALITDGSAVDGLESHGIGRCCWDAYRAELGLDLKPFPQMRGDAMPEQELHAHVTPEPREAPEPHPYTRRDLAQHRAMVSAWHSVSESGLVSFGTVVGIVEAYLASLERQRRSAEEDVL